MTDPRPGEIVVRHIDLEDPDHNILATLDCSAGGGPLVLTPVPAPAGSLPTKYTLKVPVHVALAEVDIENSERLSLALIRLQERITVLTLRANGGEAPGK